MSDGGDPQPLHEVQPLTEKEFREFKTDGTTLYWKGDKIRVSGLSNAIVAAIIGAVGIIVAAILSNWPSTKEFGKDVYALIVTPAPTSTAEVPAHSPVATGSPKPMASSSAESAEHQNR